MVDYAAAIKKPFGDTQTAIIGIILGFIPLISLLVNGYGIGIARKVVNNDNKLPKWDPGQIIQYIKDFVFAIIIGIVYMIPAGILFIIGGALAIGTIITAATAGDPNAMLGAIGGAIAAGGIFLILALILAIVGGLLSTMGVIAYTKEGSLGAAFKVGALLKKVLTGQFIATLVVYIVYSVVLIVIVGVLSIIPIVGSLIGLGLLSYATSVTGYTMFAEVYKETP